MEIYLNHIDGWDDAIISMFLSKRTLTPDLEKKVRELIKDHTNSSGDLHLKNKQLTEWLDTLFKWGTKHMTLLRFIDLSFTVYGLHRAGQDDLDAHSMRMNNRIIRSSTRLANFFHGEKSEYYQNKILTTDEVLDFLNMKMPETIEYKDHTYIKTVNGYILESEKDNKDVKRGLYMLSIPSNFIFRCQLTEFAHIYKERNKNSGANPELKSAIETMADLLEQKSNSYINRNLLLTIPN